MPDSFPPLTWGPPPFDERDLDALLSGHMTDTPVALRQVADALTSLRAAPTQAELTGEAAIRAEFRAVVLDEAVRTDGPPYAAVLSALTLDAARRRPARHRSRRVAPGARAAGPASPGGPVPARPRRTRRAGRRIGRPGGAMVGVAVLVLAVAAVAFTGSLPGPIQRLTHLSANSTPTAAHHTTGRSGSQNLSTTGGAADRTARPTAPARPSPSGHPATTKPPAQSSAQKLCREYYSYFRQQRPPGRWTSAELALFSALSKLAGNAFQIPAYCAHNGVQRWPQPGPQPGAPSQSAGPSQGNGQSGPATAGTEQAPKASSPA